MTLNIECPAIPSGIADANNAFAVEFYRQISGDENIFFSPSSIYVAFSALYEGARQNTASNCWNLYVLEKASKSIFNLIRRTAENES